MALSVNLMRKTGTSTWTNQSGQSSTNGLFSFTGLTTTQIPVGAVALRVDVDDESGNTSSSSIIVIDNANTTRRFQNAKVTDDVAANTGTFNCTTAYPWPVINDTLPAISVSMDTSNIQSQSETAAVNVACIQSVRMFLAWKPYVDNTTTKATIDSAVVTMTSLATSTGQCYFDFSSGFVSATDLVTVTKQIIAGTTTELQGGRIYTIGAKWTDATGIACTYVAADEKSFVLDTNPPNVTINAPTNGYIYNGQVVVVSGNCTDPVVG